MNPRSHLAGLGCGLVCRLGGLRLLTRAVQGVQGASSIRSNQGLFLTFFEAGFWVWF